MKFVWTTITVNDMDESLAFYQDFLGLKLNERHPAGPGTELAFLGGGDTQVELVCNGKAKIETHAEGISVGFEVESLEKTMELAKAKGLAILGDVVQPNPHIKFFFVYDPNGVKVQFVQQIK